VTLHTYFFTNLGTVKWSYIYRGQGRVVIWRETR